MQSAVAFIAPIAELQIPTLVWDRPLPKGLAHSGGFIPPGQIATASQVVGALRGFQARRCAGLVLVIDSLGGEAGACMEVFDAIRDFSRHGGVVVAYIAGQATSSAVHWALAADLVVMAPEASYQVHAAVPLDGERVAEGALYASDACRAMNEWQAATIRARAAEAPAAVTEALKQGTPRHRLKLPADVALHFGWADAIGDAGTACRLLTDLLERGTVPRSRRRAFLGSTVTTPPPQPQGEGLAMVGIAEDGVTVVDLSGGTTITNFAAVTANNASASGWVELIGYVQGRAATGTALGTLAAPGKLHNSARYVRLAATFNSANGDGVQDLDALELDAALTVVDLQTATPATHYGMTSFYYWKTAAGEVRFRGAITYDGNAGAYGAVVFTLPAEYRPSSAVIFPLTTSAQQNNGMGSVFTNGEVRVYMPTGASITAYMDPVNYQV